MQACGWRIRCGGPDWHFRCVTLCALAAVLGNMAFRRPAVQRKIQQLGGVELLLSQCQACVLLDFPMATNKYSAMLF